MSWDFSTEPEFQDKLDWIAQFVRDNIEPLDLLYADRIYQPLQPPYDEVVRALRQQVKDRGLWACHLEPALGGQGYGQLELALMNEILGRSVWAPLVFGSQAPDSGNAEILARFGTDEQKRRYLQPLLDAEIYSAFSMTEPEGGSDPTQFRLRATRDGDGWVLDGEKFFTSNLRTAAFAIVFAVTDPDAETYRRMSMFLVPTDTPGVQILRDIGLMGDDPGHGMHAYVRYDNVRLPADALLGGVGDGFLIAQTRLGGGRIHHAMRTVGLCNRAFEMMCERAVSRTAHGGPLSAKQSVQNYVADSYVQIRQLRLFVLHTAWVIDQHGAAAARTDIAAAKVLCAQVLHDVVQRAVQVHGALGVSNETPLASMWHAVPVMSIVDGPSEVHRVTVARQILKQYDAQPGPWPREHLPTRRAWAQQRFAELQKALT